MVKPPKAFLYLFEWACQLIRDTHLTYSELKAWAELTGNQIAPWEVEVLMRIDSIFHRIRNERR